MGDNKDAFLGAHDLDRPALRVKGEVPLYRTTDKGMAALGYLRELERRDYRDCIKDLAFEQMTFQTISMKVKAVYESHVLRPLRDLDHDEGEEVELEVKKNIVKRTFGLIKLDAETIDEIIEDTKYGSQ